jgi:hypothetical protein
VAVSFIVFRRMTDALVRRQVLKTGDLDATALSLAAAAQGALGLRDK